MGFYDNLQKKAGQDLAKGTVSFKEGQTLIALVPYYRKDNADAERPWLEATVVQFPDTTGLKRSMLVSRSTTNPILETESFKAAALDKNKAPITFDYIGDGLKSPALGAHLKKGTNGKPDEKSPREQTLFLYVAIVLATRENDKKSWSGCYSKAQIVTAKKGGKQSAGLHDEILRVIQNSDGAAEIEKLFVFDDKMQPRLGKPVRLIQVTRTGTGMTDTKWAAIPCADKQKVVDSPELGEKEFNGTAVILPDSVITDALATVDGDADLIDYVAGTFMPNPDELAAFCANMGIGPTRTAAEIEAEMKQAQANQAAGGATAAPAAGGKRKADG